MSNVIKIGVIGATGRIGSQIIFNIVTDKDLILERIISSNIFSSQELLKNKCIVAKVAPNINELINTCSIIIDFSVPQATKELADIIQLQNNKTFVIGTTGLDNEVIELLHKASKFNKILYSQNISIGITILNKIISDICIMLSGYDIEISEAHHNRKKDSPSGTALMLGKTIAKSLGLDFEKVMVYNRIGERKKQEIGFSSMRGGSVYGDHHVNFFGENDIITISHRVLDKQIFAQNAVRIAKILHNQDYNGFFSMNDLLKDFDNIR